MSSITLTAGQARPQICLSPINEEDFACDARLTAKGADPKEALAKATCFLDQDNDLRAALKHYRRFLTLTDGKVEHDDDRNHAKWQIYRIELLLEEEDNPRQSRSPRPPPSPDPSPPEDPAGVEVIPTPPREPPHTLCACEVGPGGSASDAWAGVIFAALAWLRRRRRR